MKKSSFFVLTTMVVSGLAVATPPEKALSQQKTVKEQIQGPWQLASCNSTDAKGAKADYCANNPTGTLILAGNGHYASTTMAGGRKDTGPGVAANFGTWSVDEASKMLTLHRISAIAPENSGLDIKANITLSGEGELHSVAVAANGARFDVSYRRFK